MADSQHITENVYKQSGFQEGKKNVEQLADAFKELMDKARKANPDIAAVEKSIKNLRGALIAARTATTDEKKAIQQDIDVLAQLKKEYVAAEKASKDRAKAGIISEESLEEAGRKSLETYREQLTSIKAVDEELKRLTLIMTEARKQTSLSDLEYNKQLTTYAQVKHQLNLLRQEYRNIEIAEAATTRAAEDAAKAQKKAADEAVKAQEKQANSLGNLIKKGVLWAAGTASFYYLYRKLRTAVIDTVKELYEETEQYKDLTDAAANFRRVMVSTAADTIHLTGIMEFFTRILTTASQAATIFRATMAGAALGTRDLAREILSGNFQEAISIFTGQRASKYQAAFADSIRDSVDLMSGAADEATDYSSQISSLVSRMADFNRAADEQAQAVREIEQAFQDASAVARGNYASSLMQIEIDLQRQISQINAKALQSRQNAYADYQDQIRDIQAQGAAQRQNDAERHALEMEFAQRRHNLSLLQNERLYQYSRGLLVAEGDVLAIEDLDARYELEKQAAEENFQLQQQQAEAMYRLQAKIQEESMRKQVAALQNALRDQLRAIEENRREEIAEAEAAAQEKKAQAADEQATALAAAIQAQEDELKAQEEGQKEREQALAEYLTDMLQTMGVSYEDALSLAQTHFGVGSEFDQTFKNTWETQATYVKIFEDAITQMVQRANAQLRTLQAQAARTWSAVTQGAGGGGRGGFGGGTPYTSPYTGRGHAHGTNEIVSSPTSFVAGEGGRSERVIVQPLPAASMSMGGNIGISWNGGAIPLHGTGDMNGANFDALSQSLAQGIVISLQESLRGMRNRN